MEWKNLVELCSSVVWKELVSDKLGYVGEQISCLLYTSDAADEHRDV